MSGDHGTVTDGWLAELVKDEPVLAAHGAAAAVGATVTALVTHDVITKVQASSLTQTVLPLATAGALLLLGVIVRAVVSPAAKFADRVEAAVQARLDPKPVASSPQHAATTSDAGVNFPADSVPPSGDTAVIDPSA